MTIDKTKVSSKKIVKEDVEQYSIVSTVFPECDRTDKKWVFVVEDRKSVV